MPDTQFNPMAAGARPLFQLIGANMNTTADQPFTKMGPFAGYSVSGALATNASASLTLAIGGIYQAAAKAGTPIVAAAQVYSGLTNPAKVIIPTVALTDVLTATPIFALTTPQGGAATADIYIYGFPLS